MRINFHQDTQILDRCWICLALPKRIGHRWMYLVFGQVGEDQETKITTECTDDQELIPLIFRHSERSPVPLLG